MKFTLVELLQPHEIFGNGWTVYGNGEIDPEAGSRLTNLIRQHKIPSRSIVYLDSPGGDLEGGMALGRAIRSAGLFTYIGKPGAEKEIAGQRYRETLPGECYSAATLAYLGGSYRWIDDKSVYGVHRFYADIDLGSDAAQVISSEVVRYVRQMGVDPDLFSEMIKAGRDEINVLPVSRLQELGITNGSTSKTAWTIESFGHGLYFKGERLTWRGINKFILIAAPKGNALHVIYDPEGRGDEAVQMRAHSVFIDNEAHPVTPGFKPYLLNGLVNCVYDISSELLAKIKDAKEVGVAMQWAYEAPVFLGFQGMELEEGRSKLKGYFTLHGR